MPFPEISPEIITFTFAGIEFAFRWYALSYIVGFIIAFFTMRYFAFRNDLWRFATSPLDTNEVDAILTTLILGVILGGRIGYVVFYQPSYFLHHPVEILQVWDGGMSFHGGFIGVILATIWYCRRHGVLLWSCADLIAIASPPGMMLGRFANFINAELWGRPTDMPWGVIFPGARAQTCPGIDGPCARHPSQLYEAGLEGLFLFFLLVVIALAGGFRRPGLVSSVFLMVYGASRYFVEFYRVPDPQFFSATNPNGFAWMYGDMGVTMGQLLSLPMIFVGILLFFFSRQPSRKG